MIVHRFNLGIVVWVISVMAACALLIAIGVIATSAGNSCTSQGGREAFQYFQPGPKGTLIPVYACEKP